MADLKAQLEITADASGVEVGVNKAKKSIKSLGASAKEAGKEASDGLKSIGEGGEESAKKLDSSAKKMTGSVERVTASTKKSGKEISDGLSPVGDAADKAEKKLTASTKNIIGSIQRQIAVMEAGSRTGSKYYETIASQRGVDVGALKPYLAQLDAMAAKQKLATQSILATAPALEKTGMSAGAMTAAMRNVPAQMTDIVVSLQGGQKPLTVLLQQGGQLKDMFGGIGPAAKALGGYVMGLVSPFTIAAAGAGILFYAMDRGAAELRDFQNTATMTGNAIGLSASQFSSMSQSIASISGTRGGAAAALTEIAKAGQLAGTQIQNIAEAAVLMEKATGQAVADTVQQFVKLADEPSKASAELNKQYNYLTASVYEQIKALEEQGNKTAAAELAEQSYATALKDRASTVIANAGLMERAWRGVTGAAKGAWDAMLNVGRESTLGDQVAVVEKLLTDRQQRNADLGIKSGLVTQQLQAQLAALKGAAQASQMNAQAIADTARANADGIAAIDAVTKANDKGASKQEQMNKALKEYRDNLAKIKAVSPTSELLSPKTIASTEAGIRDQFKGPKASKAAANLTPENIAKGQLALDLSSIKLQSAALTNIYSDSEKVMQAMRAAGLIDERDYYASKLAFLNLNSDAQSQALEQEIARLEQEKLLGKARIDNERLVAEAKAKLAKVKTDQSIGGIVLGIQDAGAQKARDTEVDKFFGDAQIAADNRNAYAVEGIRQSMLSQAQIETEAYAARMSALAIYNASRLEGEASVNALIEQEKQRHEDAMVSIKSNSDAMVFSLASQATDQMYSLLKQAGMEQSALGRVAFIASKALAVAQIILSTNVAAAAALALPPIGLGPVAGIPLAGFIKTMGYTSAAITAGLAIASAEGGYDIPGGVNPVTQLHEKEMVLPQAQANVIRDLAKSGDSGKGASGAITIVNNTSAKIAKVTEQRMSNGERALIIEEAVAATAAQFGDPNSKTSRAMGRSYNMQRSR